MERRDPAGNWTVSPKPEREKTALRQVIRNADPDILALQEIGGEGMLRELQADLRKEGIDFPYAMVAVGIDKTRQVAVLSKLKPKHWKIVRELPFSYRGNTTVPLRGLLELEFEDKEGSWFLYTLHLKSKYTNHQDDFQSLKRRTQEARVMRNYLNKKFSGEDRFVVLGDFNDTIDTAPVRSFLQVNKKRLTHAIPINDSSGLSWTHYYRKGDIYSRIDLILVSQAMYEYWLPGESGIASGKEAWRASDHRLIYADFKK